MSANIFKTPSLLACGSTYGSTRVFLIQFLKRVNVELTGKTEKCNSN